MSSEIPVKPSGSGVPGWLVAVIAVIAIIVIVGLLLIWAGVLDLGDADAASFVDPLVAMVRDLA